jgi:glycosyltransferase involved in cell wall biosynthesis
MHPIIDIIIPNYNYHTFLHDCLSSLADQRGIPIRAIILDDGSTRLPFHHLTGMGRPDLRIEYHRHRFNRGHIYTYNQGISCVRAKYYMILSPDDCILPNGLAILVDEMEKYPEASFAFGPAYTGKSPDTIKGVIGVRGFEHLPRDRTSLLSAEEFEKILSSLWFNPVPTPSVVVRTQAQHLAGGYLYTHPSAGDLEMWLRLSRMAAVLYIPRPVSFYRIHTSSMQHAYRRTDFREWLHMARVFEGVGLPEGISRLAEELAWTTRLHRALSVPPIIRQFLNYGRHYNWKRCLRALHADCRRALECLARRA